MSLFKKIGFYIALCGFLALNLLQVYTIKSYFETGFARKSLEKRQIVFSASSGEVLNDAVNPVKKAVILTNLKPDEIIGPMPPKQASQQAKPLLKAVDYKKANLSIVVTEVGGRKDNYLLAMADLPREVSFAFNPYSDDLASKMASAQKNGREVLLNLMFEPSNFPISDTGPLTIQSYLDESQKAMKIQETFSKAGGFPFKGVLSNSDEILTHNFENLTPVLKILKNKEYFFGYYRKPVNANLENDVKPLALDVFVVDYLVDEKESAESIKSKLNEIRDELLKNHRRKDVICIRANPVSIDTLRKWLEKNISDDLQIAPISYFITDN